MYIYNQFKEKLSDFFPWDFPLVQISPEWVKGTHQSKSSGRIATFSLWTDMVDPWIDFWIRETGKRQQVPQLHAR